MNININEVKRLLDSQYQELECGDDNIKFNVLSLLSRKSG